MFQIQIKATIYRIYGSFKWVNGFRSVINFSAENTHPTLPDHSTSLYSRENKFKLFNPFFRKLTEQLWITKITIFGQKSIISGTEKTYAEK